MSFSFSLSFSLYFSCYFAFRLFYTFFTFFVLYYKNYWFCLLLYLFFPSLARFFTFSCVYSISFTCLSIIFLYLFCCLFSWFLYVYSFWSSVNQEVLNQTSFHVRLFGGGWNMTSRKGKQGKQPPPPFSSQVMAALGREVQSNFGQQNSAAVALISSNPMLHPESRWMKYYVSNPDWIFWKSCRDSTTFH